MSNNNRKININQGNYNENIHRDYIQGDRNDNRDMSKKIEVGGNLNAENSNLMSDNASVNSVTKLDTPNNQINWSKWSLIIAIITIFTSISFSGIFNDEFRKLFKLDPSPETIQQN